MQYESLRDIFSQKTSTNLFKGNKLLESQIIRLNMIQACLKDIQTNEQQDMTYDKIKNISALHVVDGNDGNSSMAATPTPTTVKLYTRGDGQVGQNISHLIPFINGLPAVAPKGPLMVRGELIMTRAAFEAYGKGANARNTVSGLVNAKMPDLDVAKNVGFVAYANIGKKPSTGLAQLAKMNFKVVTHKVLGKDALTFDGLSATLMDRRVQSLYEIDGLVVAHDAVHEEAIGKNPDSAFAFKHLLMADTAEVVVTKVVWSLSKDGLIKPVVEFAPVHLTGVTIRRATGFNAAYMRDGRIGPGARLLITRSGDVIPYIMQVLVPAEEASMPEPSAYKYVWTGNKDIKVVGESAEIDVKQLENFFDKLEIKGLRRATVQKLFDGGVTTVRAFMELKQKDLEAIQGFANKWPLIAEAHADIRAAPCLKLMNASNAFGMGFGDRKLKAIATGIPSIMNPAAAPPTVDELVAIEGIAPLTAGKFIEGLAAFRQFLKDSGLHCATSKKVVNAARPRSASPNGSRSKSPAKTTKAASLALVGQVVVFTGFRNKEWSSRIEELGGEVGSSVTKSTTILVAKEIGGDKETGKLAAARAKGIMVMDAARFEKLIA